MWLGESRLRNSPRPLLSSSLLPHKGIAPCLAQKGAQKAQRHDASYEHICLFPFHFYLPWFLGCRSGPNLGSGEAPSCWRCGRRAAPRRRCGARGSCASSSGKARELRGERADRPSGRGRWGRVWVLGFGAGGWGVTQVLVWF